MVGGSEITGGCGQGAWSHGVARNALVLMGKE